MALADHAAEMLAPMSMLRAASSATDSRRRRISSIFSFSPDASCGRLVHRKIFRLPTWPWRRARSSALSACYDISEIITIVDGGGENKAYLILLWRLSRRRGAWRI